MEFLFEGDKKRAIRSFKKVLEIDDEHIDAYNSMGSIFWDNLKKAKQYYQKAYELTEKHFNSRWPDSIEWGILENRKYLRAIHGFGLILWREGNPEEAKQFFMLLLKLNKNDNQGIRYLIAAIFKGLTWEEFKKMEDKAMETGNYGLEEKLLEEQNKIHNFWEYEE